MKKNISATKISSIGIFGKQITAENKEKAAEMKEAILMLKKYSWEIFYDEYSAAVMKEKTPDTRAQIAKKVDMLVTIGGDGTVLKAVESITKKDQQVLSINIGNVGFLTETNLKNLKKVLDEIAKGNAVTDERSMIEVSVHRGKKEILKLHALNEIIFNQSPFARLMKMSIHVDDQKAATMRADGLIISTPTGSTGHSLSANGPILHPATDVLLVNPVCAVGLSIRPIVVPGKSKIRFELHEKSEKNNTWMTLDGQRSHEIVCGDEVLVQKFYQRLQEKLSWTL
jgi:NAD+ kinase